MASELLSIGRLAKRSGIPVKTIRYYDEAGLLAPSALSAGGYRLYSEADAARLESIRMLRELDFSIAAIREMLAGKSDPEALLAMQLDLARTQMRSLRRQTAILERALSDGGDPLRALHLAHAAASLGAAERNASIDAFLSRARGERSDRPAMDLRASVLEGLPEDLTPGQLEAWLQLHALLEDPQLQATMDRQRQGFGGALPRDPQNFTAGIMEILALAVSYYKEQRPPSDPQVRRLSDRWAKFFARNYGKRYDAAFARWFAEFAEETNDPRIERFWHLVAVLHGRPTPPPFHAAQTLLIEGLLAHICVG